MQFDVRDLGFRISGVCVATHGLISIRVKALLRFRMGGGIFGLLYMVEG